MTDAACRRTASESRSEVLASRSRRTASVSMASTILNEEGFPPDHIERQLAHSERNAVRAAYNHAEYLEERRKMMQWWGDFLLPEEA